MENAGAPQRHPAVPGAEAPIYSLHNIVILAPILKEIPESLLKLCTPNKGKMSNWPRPEMTYVHGNVSMRLKLSTAEIRYALPIYSSDPEEPFRVAWEALQAFEDHVRAEFGRSWLGSLEVLKAVYPLVWHLEWRKDSNSEWEPADGQGVVLHLLDSVFGSTYHEDKSHGGEQVPTNGANNTIKPAVMATEKTVEQLAHDMAKREREARKQYYAAMAENRARWADFYGWAESNLPEPPTGPESRPTLDELIGQGVG